MAIKVGAPLLALFRFNRVTCRKNPTKLQHVEVWWDFLLLARFEYLLLPSEENEEDREVSLLVLLSETCSESPHLSDPSATFLHEPVTDQSPHDFGQREPIERDKLRMFRKRAFQARNPFVQQHTTSNTRSFKKFSYNRNKNGIPNSWLFLAGEHASPRKLKFYTREE